VSVTAILFFVSGLGFGVGFANLHWMRRFGVLRREMLRQESDSATRMVDFMRGMVGEEKRRRAS
jgi:hypothetical protein